MVKTTKRFPIIKSKSTFNKMLQDGDISDNAIQTLIEDSNQMYSNGKLYSFIPPNGKKGNVLSCNGDGVYEWVNIANNFGVQGINFFAYGIQWENGTNNCQRVGLSFYHQTLPIQNKMKGVIAQGDTIIYDLHPDDWRFRKEPIYANVNITTDINNDLILESDEFKNLRYEDQYIKVPVTISYETEPELALEDGLQVGEQNLIYHIYTINTTAGIAHAELYLHPYNWITETTQHTLQEYLDAGYSFTVNNGLINIELGSCRNGYDGLVRVYVPQFYIWSDMTDTQSLVLISEVKINKDWTEQPESLVDAYCCTQLNTVPENMGYLSTLKVNSFISVLNKHDYCIGEGNGGKVWAYGVPPISTEEIEQFSTSHPFITNYGKSRGYQSTNKETVDTDIKPYLSQTKSQMMTLYDYQNILYWLFAIEYNTLIFNKGFNSNLTEDGYKQGGHGNVERPNSGGYIGSRKYLGKNVWNYFPLGLGDHLGNNIGLVKYPSFSWYIDSVYDEFIINGSPSINRNAATGNGNVTITSITDCSQFIYSYASDPNDMNGVIGPVKVSISGLVEGQELSFYNEWSNNLLLTVSSDGEYTIPFTYLENGARRYVFSNINVESCNLKINIIENSPKTTIRNWSDSGVIPRWRGFDTLVTFGTIVDCYGVGKGDVADIIDHEGNILQQVSSNQTGWYKNNQYNLGKSANILFTKNDNPQIHVFETKLQNNSSGYMIVSDYFLNQQESDISISNANWFKLRTITHLR